MNAQLKDWRPYIERALEYADGKWTMKDIEGRLILGTAQLWSQPDCAGITWLEDYPGKRCLVVAFAGGNMESMFEHMPDIESFASSCGCQQIDVYGRGGWEKVLQPFGFTKTSTICSKELAL